MSLIFLISVFKDEAVQLQDVASHASNAWMTGLCRAVIAHGINLRTVGHEPARVWPLGRHILPGKVEHLRENLSQRLVRYVNLPLLRGLLLCCGYHKAVSREIRDATDAIICTYNLLPWQVYAAQAAVKKGARWASFVLDDEVVALCGWGRYVRQTRAAACHVFVSQWAYDHAPVTNKLLLEGGIDEWRGQEREQLSTVPSVMYAGLLCDAAGLKELLALIDATSDNQIEFWICGKGVSPELAQRAKRDQRIKMLGFLSEYELSQRLQSAWVLINPRSATHEASRMNFPSKLLRYLSCGKPIVTVWTPGISAEYRNVLLVVDPDVCGSSPARLGQELGVRVREVLGWKEAERQEWRERIKHFIIPAKLWSIQVRRLLEFVENRNSSATVRY